MAWRLKREAAEFKHLDEFFSIMEKMGISIAFGSYSTLVTINGKEFELRDAEDGRQIDELPPSFEYKLTFDKDE
jgi:hypothetical protein